MAKNRKTTTAPAAFTSVTKTTLADLVWWLALAASPDKSSEAVCRLIAENANTLSAPSRDVALFENVGGIRPGNARVKDEDDLTRGSPQEGG